MNDQTPPPIEPDDGDVLPGSILNVRQTRILKIAVIAMGIILIAGFALLVGIIAYRATHPPAPPPPIAPAGVTVPQASLTDTPPVADGAPPPRTLDAFIPAGATPVSTALNGNHLALVLQTSTKDLQILLIDLRQWRLDATATLRQK